MSDPITRCVILSCSMTKIRTSGEVPAIVLYGGPAFKVIAKYMRQAPEVDIDIYVLSAEHGLIGSNDLVSYYDREMTDERADELRPTVTARIKELADERGYTSIFVSMGRSYLRSIVGLQQLLGDDVELMISNNSIGMMLQELQYWLNKVPYVYTPKQEKLRPPPPADKPTHAKLRGRELVISTEDATAKLVRGIAENPTSMSVFHIRDWYAEVGKWHVNPKWAAGYLFEVPTNEFAADEARRVLRGLGIVCKRQEWLPTEPVVAADTEVMI
jgi:hypothetical protein